MPHTRFIIVRHEDEWLIKFGDGEYGPYRSQAEAMLFAIDAAQNWARKAKAPRWALWASMDISVRNGATAGILIRLRVYSELGPLGLSNLWRGPVHE
jgi:hypothetical protein